MEWAIVILKWLIGLLILGIMFVITKGLCRLGYATRESGWVYFF